MALTIASIWERNVQKFLTDSNDLITVYYKPVRVTNSVKFDAFFQESSNPADPTNTGVDEVTPANATARGKLHMDLYGTSLGFAENEQQLQIGRFGQYDALFSCVLSTVQTQADPLKTIFDDADYIITSKDNKRYNIDAIKYRGMSESLYICDVFLKATNK